VTGTSPEKEREEKGIFEIEIQMLVSRRKCGQRERWGRGLAVKLKPLKPKVKGRNWGGEKKQKAVTIDGAK